MGCPFPIHFSRRASQASPRGRQAEKDALSHTCSSTSLLSVKREDSDTPTALHGWARQSRNTAVTEADRNRAGQLVSSPFRRGHVGDPSAKAVTLASSCTRKGELGDMTQRLDEILL